MNGIPWELTALAGVAALGWFWYDGMRARELAIGIARRALEREDAQLLDDTVALTRLRLRRGASGAPVLVRVFGFEWSDTGNNRLQGAVILEGQRLETVWLERREVELPPPVPISVWRRP